MEIELNFKISDFGVQLSDTHREKILISSLSFSFKTEVTITPLERLEPRRHREGGVVSHARAECNSNWLPGSNGGCSLRGRRLAQQPHALLRGAGAS